MKKAIYNFEVYYYILSFYFFIPLILNWISDYFIINFLYQFISILSVEFRSFGNSFVRYKQQIIIEKYIEFLHFKTIDYDTKSDKINSLSTFNLSILYFKGSNVLKKAFFLLF